MKSLVYFGAPKNILLNGKPHLGTDRLIPLLRNIRQHLEMLGVSIYPIPVLGFVCEIKYFSSFHICSIFSLNFYDFILGQYQVWDEG